jgi:predicted oxidoreductase
LAIDSQVEKGTTARWMMMGEDDLSAGGDRIYPIVGWEERGGETKGPYNKRYR